MDQSILASVLGALAAGALAKAQDVASDAVNTSYEELKRLLVSLLGKSGAVQSVEDEPESEGAQATLAEALAKTDLQAHAGLQAQVQQLQQALLNAKTAAGGPGDIEIDRVQAEVNVFVQRLVATGRIKIRSMVAKTGDLCLTDISSGAQAGKITLPDGKEHPPSPLIGEAKSGRDLTAIGTYIELHIPKESLSQLLLPKLRVWRKHVGLRSKEVLWDFGRWLLKRWLRALVLGAIFGLVALFPVPTDQLLDRLVDNFDERTEGNKLDWQKWNYERSQDCTLSLSGPVHAVIRGQGPVILSKEFLKRKNLYDFRLTFLARIERGRELGWIIRVQEDGSSYYHFKLTVDEKRVYLNGYKKQPHAPEVPLRIRKGNELLQVEYLADRDAFEVEATVNGSTFDYSITVPLNKDYRNDTRPEIGEPQRVASFEDPANTFTRGSAGLLGPSPGGEIRVYNFRVEPIRRWFYGVAPIRRWLY